MKSTNIRRKVAGLLIGVSMLESGAATLYGDNVTVEVF